ncbi:MAG: hypothetical protein H0U74_12860 [Bradymonadaceae bacterium]|nr:hypothetical protein [Lujinxingiaceae bacterium]
MTRKMHVVAALMCTIAFQFSATLAFAGDNDLVLSRFATFDPKPAPGTSCENACGTVVPNEDLFNSLLLDLGQVFGPRFIGPADTLGQAGFAVVMMTSLSGIPHQEQHWSDGVENGNPSSQLFTSHLQIRKGLPFSFEVAGNLAYMFASEMFTMGADVKWALNEGFYYFPDVAVRGSLNTLMGASDMNMVTTGWDVSMSKGFDISGVMALTPYVGYQQLFIIGSSRLLNAYPQDPRPPQYDPDNPGRTFSPEFVFGQRTLSANRFFLGSRLNVWILSFTLEAIFGETVNQFTFAGGVDF